MPNTMIMNGITTVEVCPVCQCPDAICEHGASEKGTPMHYWHCPNPDCEGNQDSMAFVFYDCPHCGLTAEGKPLEGGV